MYTSRTAQEKNWGLLKEQEKWDRENCHRNWIWYPPEYKWVGNNQMKGRDERGDEQPASASISPAGGSVCRGETGDRSKAREETGLLNFGTYQDWTYGELMAQKPNYVSYICNESMGSSPSQQQFQEWVTLMSYHSENHGWKKDEHPKRPKER